MESTNQNLHGSMMEAPLDSKPRVSFEFEVEKVIGVSGDGRYQVQWAPAWVSKFHLVGCEHLIQEFLQRQSEEIRYVPEVQVVVSDVRSLIQEFLTEQSAREMKAEPESFYEISEDITHEVEGNQCERIEEISEPDCRLSPSLESLTNTMEVGVESLKEDTQKTLEYSLGGDTEANNCLKFVSLMEDVMNSPTLLEKEDKDLVNTSTVLLQVKSESSVTCTRSSSVLTDGVTVVQNEVGNNQYCTEAEREEIVEHEIHQDPPTEFDGPDETNFHRISQPFSSGIAVNDEGNSLETTGASKLVKHFTASHDLIGTSSKNKLDEPNIGVQASDTQQLEIASNHEGKRYSCTVCDKQFPKLTNLTCHIRSHSGEKRHKCPHCDKSYARRWILKQHLNTHTGAKPYSCTQCSYATSARSNLSVHIRIHTGEKPFACEHCSYSSRVKWHLKRHLRTHTGEKPFPCNQCTYSSVDRSHLKRHLRTHTREKPYSCGVCGRKFGRAEHRNRHMNKVHERHMYEGVF